MTERRRILVVDDTNVVRELVRAMLEESYEVATAVSGPDAIAALHIALARRELPALVLVDHVMPGMSGVDLVRTLRARPEFRQRPIVGYSASDDASEMVKAGCCETIRKPVRREALLEIVSATLARCGESVGCAYCCHATLTPPPAEPAE